VIVNAILALAAAETIFGAVVFAFAAIDLLHRL
jgi:hypothetical protein